LQSGNRIALPPLCSHPFSSARSRAGHLSAGDRMNLNVSNSRPEHPVVTLFGQLDNGSYVGRVMEETQVPYRRCWDNALDQVMVYIEPDDSQLEAMLNALNNGTLDYSNLQNYGASTGGTSTIPV
jgi:hypothetical protein